MWFWRGYLLKTQQGPNYFNTSTGTGCRIDLFRYSYCKLYWKGPGTKNFWQLFSKNIFANCVQSCLQTRLCTCYWASVEETRISNLRNKYNKKTSQLFCFLNSPINGRVWIEFIALETKSYVPSTIFHIRSPSRWCDICGTYAAHPRDIIPVTQRQWCHINCVLHYRIVSV